jgi:large subunit ribosomal protein L10
MINPKPSGFSTTRQGKALIIERTKALVDQSSLILTFPCDGVTKEEIDMLRNSYPPEIKTSVVKNKLMAIAVKGSQFEVLSESLRDQNMHIFVPEGEYKVAFEKFNSWLKEVKRDEKTQSIKFGAMEGQLYTGQALDNISKLPTKLEIITKIALGIKAVPTKLAKSIKVPQTKVVKAIAAVKKKMEEEGSK